VKNSDKRRGTLYLQCKLDIGLVIKQTRNPADARIADRVGLPVVSHLQGHLKLTLRSQYATS